MTDWVSGERFDTLWIIRVEIVFRSNFVSLRNGTVQRNAARIPNSNARLFTTEVPWISQSMTFVFVFGSAPEMAGDGENILNQF